MSERERERERGGKVTVDVRWGPQLDQATYKNRQRLYLSEQFNEETHSPFVKEYKTIIHPGETFYHSFAYYREGQCCRCAEGSSPHDPDPRPCLGHFNRNVGSPKGQANASMATRLSKLQQQLEVEKHATYDAQADQCCYHDMALKS
nr:PREDICTED: uncharacterized protein LOC103980027 isoform X2 [Musa acuminata subsp. malaccensis]